MYNHTIKVYLSMAKWLIHKPYRVLRITIQLVEATLNKMGVASF